ncbi:uncharacterized protein LOC100586881 [Nomascus leucogenys]|uniref:uncharacterized protein LOC100586881 n=1 Tax=Nomascus leucogenys TaxID=61853 RepID=UPI00122DA046|nr:uncharacterized protein LOC100586881 [Nomascus leucogenys]
MDFYTNIHKSRGDRGSSITASSDTVSPFNYSTRGREDRKGAAEAALRAEAARWRSVGARMRENLAELDRAASGGAARCPASGGAKVRATWAAPPERRGEGAGLAARRQSHANQLRQPRGCLQTLTLGSVAGRAIREPDATTKRPPREWGGKAPHPLSPPPVSAQ